jgi:hypothetical protein
MGAMRAYLGAAAVLAAALAAPSAGAQVKQLTVPNVTVTAPAPPSEPPYLRGDPWQSYARNPYVGRYRVDEDRFAKVPCADTRIAAAGPATCLWGYRLQAGQTYARMGNIPAGGDRCDMALDVTMFNIADLAVEADVLIFDPWKLTSQGYPGRDCYVEGFAGYGLQDFEDMNQVTRRGSNWQDLRGAGDEKSAAFSDGAHNCVAIRRPGPPWQGGYVYILTATICRSDTASVLPEDIARALAPLQIRQYDPVGNLRPPPQ